MKIYVFLVCETFQIMCLITDEGLAHVAVNEKVYLWVYCLTVYN